MARNSRRIVAALVAVALLVLLAELLAEYRAGALFGDFRAFYCGGWTLLHGQNPYATAPILRCESVPLPAGLHYVHDSVAWPAPFPGYALAMYAIFALLPSLPAIFAWFALLIASTVAAAFFLGKLCDVPPVAALVLLTWGFAIAVIPNGENAPVVLALLAGSALAARMGRWNIAHAALAFVALLPHIALPVYAALFVWRKASRVPLLLIGSALLIADLLAGGPSLAMAYFTRVLPAHAASEVGYITQYSMTWAAQALGANERAALLLGDCSYAVMVALGVWLAGALARAYRDPAFTLLVPAALAVIGGPFIHYSEIMLALPAALLLYARSGGAARAFSAGALVLVAIPWQALTTYPARVAEIAVGAFLIAVSTLGVRVAPALRIAVGATLVGAAIVLTAAHFGPQTAVHAGAMHVDPALAQASWARDIGRKSSSNGAIWWIAKAPTWAGLLLLTLSCAYAVAKKDVVAPVAIEQAPAGA